MRSTAITIAAAAGFAASASATSAEFVRNNCTQTVYLVGTNQAGTITYNSSLAPGGSIGSLIQNVGDSLSMAKSSDYYSTSTAKLVLGTSTSSGTLYWALGLANGNPFPVRGFEAITYNGQTSGVCGSTTTADGQTYSCPDENVSLDLTLCEKPE